MSHYANYTIITKMALQQLPALVGCHHGNAAFGGRKSDAGGAVHDRQSQTENVRLRCENLQRNSKHKKETTENKVNLTFSTSGNVTLSN